MFGRLLLGALFLAQVNSGRISGNISDVTGASVPLAVVTITNQSTGLKYKGTSDGSGFYQVTNLPIGVYDVEAVAPGFRGARTTGFDLVDDGKITANFTLSPATVSSTVEVRAAAGETINTISGEISHVINSEQVRDLALNGRNYMELTSLIPGVAVTSLDQMALTTSLSVSNQSINGMRTDSTHLMVDGGMNLDSGSNGSQNNNVGVDFIQEVKIQTSSFSAQYGRNSGGSVNVVTKSGGNQFHGSLFEYLRNDYLDAQDYFAPVKPELRFHDFGWSLGGPIYGKKLKKGKFFFFGGQEYKKIQRFTNPSRQTLPTLAEIKGDFSDRPTATINFPGTKNPIPGKNLAPYMTVDGKAVMAVYAAVIPYASAYSNTPTSNNATFQVLNPFRFREDITRVDWHPSDNHSLYARYLHDNYNTIDPFGSFTASALPTTPTKRDRPGYGIQAGYTWSIRPNLLNQVLATSSWNGQRTPLQGTNWERSTYGFQFPRTFGGNGLWSTGIPDVTVSGFASYNGPARVYLISPTTDILLSDTLTYVHSRHNLTSGIQLIRNRKDQNGRTVYDGSVAFNTSSNTNTTGYSLADAALGQFQTYTEAGSDPTGFYRFTQIEGFVEDSWKAANNLSMSIGVRYSHFVPTYTAANNIANFDPTLYNPAQAVKLTTAGLIVPGSGNLYNGLIRAGDGVPADQLARVPGGDSALAKSVPSGAPRGLYDGADLWMPRVSLAWRPLRSDKFVVRTGFGTTHDRTQGNLIFSQSNLPPYSFSAQYQSGNLAQPSGAAVPPPAPIAVRGIDPHLKVPVTYMYNFGIQTQLPSGIFLEVSYVGNQSRHQLYSPNINQPSFAALVANNAIPSASRPATNSIVPYAGYTSSLPFFESVANANYNGLQTYLARRKGNLVMTVSYTYSKALSEANSYNDGGDGVEAAVYRHYNYGPASIDRRHIFVATYNYRLPFLRNRQGFAGTAFGGWELSGVTRLQSGAYLTPTGSSIVTRRSSYLGGDVALPSDQRDANHWFNTAAFATAPTTVLGNAGVGVIEGPGWENWNISLRKNFHVRERFNIRFTAETFNAFNHVNLDAPAVSTSGAGFGAVTSSQPGRQIQFGVHIAF